ncbi:MAG: proton-conducting transporter membrane subunit [Acidimicrobiales bacterium]
MNLVVLPVVLPLFAAGLALLSMRSLTLQRVVALGANLAALGAAIALLVAVESDGIQAQTLGGWPAGVGITLVADLAAAMFLVVSLVVIATVQVFAIGQGADEARPRIGQPVYLVLSAGVSLSFLTGDLFNLFVAFEVMLIASYVLLTMGAGAAQVRAGMTYVVINVLASTLLLSTVGLIYGATGTVNMAELVTRYPELPQSTQTALGILLISVFAIKAALFPFFFWLPDSYPTAPVAVTAVFAGLLTKVGIYTLIRATTILDLDSARWVLVMAATLTMVVGVVGAIVQSDIKRILSFHIISQVGYMVMGLAIGTVAGLTGAVLYVVHHIPVKTALFLVGGLVEDSTGSGRLHRLGGLVRRAPILAILFTLPALSLAGMPPFSGFLAKLAVITAGLEAEEYMMVTAALVASLLTIFSMSKIWAGVFWGTADDPTPALADAEADDRRLPIDPVTTAATAALVLATLVVPVFGGAVYDLAERAAVQLLDSRDYVEAVRNS